MQLKWEPSKKDSDKARVLVQLGFQINVVHIKNWPSRFSQNFQFLKVPFLEKSIPRWFDFSKSRFPEILIYRKFDFPKVWFPVSLISRNFDFPKVWFPGASITRKFDYTENRAIFGADVIWKPFEGYSWSSKWEEFWSFSFCWYDRTFSRRMRFFNCLWRRLSYFGFSSGDHWRGKYMVHGSTMSHFRKRRW